MQRFNTRVSHANEPQPADIRLGLRHVKGVTVPLLLWLYAAVWPNLVASAITFVIAWFWKIRPHLHAQREHREAVAEHLEHESAHREKVEHWFRMTLDAIEPSADEGRHAATETFPRVGGDL